MVSGVAASSGVDGGDGAAEGQVDFGGGLDRLDRGVGLALLEAIVYGGSST